MARSNLNQKGIFSYLLPFLILIVLIGGGFFGFRYYMEWQSQPMVEEIKPVATLSIESGKVEVKLVDVSGWNRATPGMTLYTGDSVRTMADSIASIEYFDNSVTRLDANSKLLIKMLQKDEKSDIVDLELESGRAWARVMKVVDENSRFEIETPTAVATVRGTAFEVIVERQIITDSVTGETRDIYGTKVRVIENEVGFQAIEKTTTEDKQGNIRIEKRVLASVILPAGSESQIDDDDVREFAKEPAKKPQVKSIDPEVKQEDWYRWNEQEDKEYLENISKKLRQTLDKIEERGLVERLFRSKFERKQEKAIKSIFYQVESQLKQISTNSDDISAPVDSNDSNNSDDADGENSNATDTTLESTPADRQHIVQPGDTLSAIASRYGISIEDLMRANGLTDPNMLKLDQELIIPGDLSNLPELVKPVVKPAVRPYTSSTTTIDDTSSNNNSSSSSSSSSRSASQPDTHVEDDEPFSSPQ